MAINKRIINPGFEAPLPPVTTSFNTVTYTGAQGTQPRSITGVGFKPDFVWIKERTSTSSHSLADIVRGVGLILQSDLSNAEINVVANLVSFDSDGFTIYNSNGVNETGQDYVAWCWKAGGAAVTNTNGTITSQVSANVEAGFSIVSYTGSVSINQTVGHGLDSKPDLIIVKNRDEAGNGWPVYNSFDGADFHMILNGTQEAKNNVDWIWADTEPTASVFTVGQFGLTNQSPDRFIAYCWHSVAGFSKIGSYTGTGAAGNKQTMDFEPAFLLVKKSSNTGSWHILDNKRDTSNPITARLQPSDSDAETSPAYGMNFYSDGFDFTSGAYNDSGDTYIYMAFANQF